jgi:hypothetical protein
VIKLAFRRGACIENAEESLQHEQAFVRPLLRGLRADGTSRRLLDEWREGIIVQRSFANRWLSSKLRRLFIAEQNSHFAVA